MRFHALALTLGAVTSVCWAAGYGIDVPRTPAAPAVPPAAAAAAAAAAARPAQAAPAAPAAATPAATAVMPAASGSGGGSPPHEFQEVAHHGHCEVREVNCASRICQKFWAGSDSHILCLQQTCSIDEKSCLDDLIEAEKQRERNNNQSRQ